MPPSLPDPQMADRLREARQLAGFDSAIDAWRAHDFPVRDVTYQQHESGLRGFGKHVARYAVAYRVREEWLRYGKGHPKGGMERVAISGSIGPFGIVGDLKESKMPDSNAKLTERPPSPADLSFVAYQVVGDHNYPSLFNGDIVFVGMATTPESCVGRQCVVTLSDGTQRICILTRAATGGPDSYLLVSLNASPLTAEVTAAAPVLWIKRGC